MVKLVDMPDLGSGAARRVGSSPILGKMLHFDKSKGRASRPERSPILGKMY